jgi:hypothetical protein
VTSEQERRKSTMPKTNRKAAPAPFVKGQISPSQIKAIHAAKGKMGLDDEIYRDMLDSRFKVRSCKGLTWRQAEELLDELNGASTPLLTHRKRSLSGAEGRTLKFTDFDNRPGFATGAQCRLLAAMWSQVSRAEDGEAQEKALNSFCYRITGVAGLRMVKGWQVQKILKAMETMGAEKREKEPGVKGQGSRVREQLQIPSPQSPISGGSHEL